MAYRPTLLIVSLLGLYAQIGLCNSNKIDSLRKELAMSIEDSVQCRILNEIGSIYYQENEDTAIYFHDKSLQIAKLKGYKHLEARSLRYLGDVYSQKAQYQKAIELYLESIHLFKEVKEKQGLSNSYIGLGRIHQEIGNYPKSIEYYQLVLNIESELGDKNRISLVYNNLGITYRILGNYDLAISYYQKSGQIKDEIGDKRGIAYSFANIGVVYRNQGHYDKAIENYLWSLKVFEELNDKDGIAKSYNNIGNIYYYQDNYEKALENFRMSLKMSEELLDKKGIARSYVNMGMIFRIEGEYDIALEHYMTSLKIFRELSDKVNMANCYNNIGVLYQTQGFNKLAINEFLKSLKIREEINDKAGLVKTYLNIASLKLNSLKKAPHNKGDDNFGAVLYYTQQAYTLAIELKSISLQNNVATAFQELYEKAGKYEEAIQWSKVRCTTRDSLYNEDKMKTIAEMQIKFETEKKQQEIEKQQLIIEKQDFDYRRQIVERNFIAAVGIIILLVAIGSIYGIVAIRNKNRKLAQSELELKQLVKTKDRLFSIIAHDLRSPFTSLVGLTELMASNDICMDQEKTTRYSRLIHTMSLSLFGLIENLLHWSRNQTGQIKNRPQNLSIADIINEITTLLQLQAENKNIALLSQVPENIAVFADYEMLSTIIRNIVSNAIKFTPNGGSISINASQNEKTMILKISDTGVGFSPENLARLFKSEDTFSTNGTNEEHGTGLGLIICKEFVEKNGGTISVESEPEQGTTFTISLPVGSLDG